MDKAAETAAKNAEDYALSDEEALNYPANIFECLLTLFIDSELLLGT